MEKDQHDPSTARQRAEEAQKPERWRMDRSFVQAGGEMMGSAVTDGHPTKEGPSLSASLDRRIERAVERARQQSAESTNLFYQANQLSAFLDCLPRRLPEAAAEGLRLILDRAGF